MSEQPDGETLDGPSGTSTPAEPNDERSAASPDPADRSVDAPAGPVAATGGGDRRRSRVPTVLIVIATVIGVFSALTTWVRTEALDTNQWVSTADDLLDQPEVRDALAQHLTDELFTRVDVASEVASLLPDQVGALAQPIAGALEGAANDAARRVIASDQFAEVWSRVNRLAHEQLVAILRDETPDAVSTSDGTVTLSLSTAVRSVGEALGVPSSALDRLSEDAGDIVVFQSNELADVQETVQVLDFLSWFLFVVVVGLYALAFFLGRRHWRLTVRSIGVGLLVGGLAVLALRTLGVRWTVDAVVEDGANEGVATLVADVVTDLLRQMGWTAILLGVLFILYAALLGDHRWARSVRGVMAGWSTVAVVAVSVGVLALLAWWSPGRALDRWATGLLVVAVAIAFVVGLVVQLRRESSPAAAP